MRPSVRAEKYGCPRSVRAEKYIRDASGRRKDVTDGNDNGTDGQTECDAICGLRAA